MAEPRQWPALTLRAARVLTPFEEEALAALLDDYRPIAVQDLAELPLPPGGLWDPSFPPPPEPPPAPLQWRVFFDQPADRDAADAAVRAFDAHLAVAREDVADDNWAARSQQALTAVRAGRFVVAPPWDVPADTDGVVLIIEPSRGFGTGHHASTRLCLRLLSATPLDGRSVLDLGTGSGVLAMAAHRSGAREVVAVDIDPDAIEAARESAALTDGMDAITWLVGDFRDRAWPALAGGPWQIVIANLTGGMLIASAPRLRELVADEGVLIVSGFDTSEADAVIAALALPRQAWLIEDSWVGAVLQRP